METPREDIFCTNLWICSLWMYFSKCTIGQGLRRCNDKSVHATSKTCCMTHPNYRQSEYIWYLICIYRTGTSPYDLESIHIHSKQQAKPPALKELVSLLHCAWLGHDVSPFDKVLHQSLFKVSSISFVVNMHTQCTIVQMLYKVSNDCLARALYIQYCWMQSWLETRQSWTYLDLVLNIIFLNTDFKQLHNITTSLLALLLPLEGPICE